MTATGGQETRAPGAGSAVRVVDARIVYWGIAGAGKGANLRAIHARLREDHRGALRRIPTPLDPSVTYAVLPIELGEVSGVRTRLEIVAVPGGADDAPTRKQLLDRADGVVFVVDSRRDRLDANVASFEELRRTLAAYGRSLEHVPLVIQYNQRDLADPYALEELHRKLEVPGATVFEAVASSGNGVLQTLTTISKRVVRARREGGTPITANRPAASRAEPAAAPPRPPAAAARMSPAPAAPPRPASSPVAAPARVSEPSSGAEIAGRARSLFDASFHELAAGLEAPLTASAGELVIASVGTARVLSPRSLELPLALVSSDGREYRTLLTLTLDPSPGDPTPGGRTP